MSIDPRFEIRSSHPQIGKGLFARVLIPASEFIAEYTGEKIRTNHADTLKTRYLFEVDDKWTIDGSTMRNLARYINHACMPNCEADIRDSRIYIHALRDIEKGEELTIDYGEEYFDEFIRPVGCKCMSCFSAVYSIS